VVFLLVPNVVLNAVLNDVNVALLVPRLVANVVLNAVLNDVDVLLLVLNDVL